MTEFDDLVREHLAGLSDDELKRLGTDVGVDISLPSAPDEPRPTLNREQRRKAKLVSARSLLPPGADLDQGDFEPGLSGMLYKGFRIIPEHEWPPEAHRLPSPGVAGHANQKRRFYVESETGEIGMVPWEGSQVVWPWESGWEQDLYRPEVTSLLKEEKKERKPK